MKTLLSFVVIAGLGVTVAVKWFEAPSETLIGEPVVVIAIDPRIGEVPSPVSAGPIPGSADNAGSELDGDPEGIAEENLVIPVSQPAGPDEVRQEIRELSAAGRNETQGPAGGAVPDTAPEAPVPTEVANRPPERIAKPPSIENAEPPAEIAEPSPAETSEPSSPGETSEPSSPGETSEPSSPGEISEPGTPETAEPPQPEIAGRPHPVIALPVRAPRKLRPEPSGPVAPPAPIPAAQDSDAVQTVPALSDDQVRRAEEAQRRAELKARAKKQADARAAQIRAQQAAAAAKAKAATADGWQSDALGLD